jgi:hypothetical protein
VVLPGKIGKVGIHRSKPALGADRSLIGQGINFTVFNGGLIEAVEFLGKLAGDEPPAPGEEFFLVKSGVTRRTGVFFLGKKGNL